MTLLADVTIKVSLIAVLALIAMLALRRRSAALRHWVLAMAMLGAAVAPFLRPIVPGWGPDVAASATPTTLMPAAPRNVGTPRTSGEEATFQAAAAASATTFPLTSLLLWTWAAGAFVSLAILAIGLFRLRAVSRSAESPADRSRDEVNRQAGRLGIAARVRLLRSTRPIVPATWGWPRATIVVPGTADEWPEDRLAIVLQHELTHVRRGDWLVQLLAECVRSIYWFNPLVWILSTRLRQESEQACDDEVLGLGVAPSTYATHLLAVARSAVAGRNSIYPGLPAQWMARPSSLERRFAVMLDARTNRQPLTQKSRLVATLAAAIVAIVVAGLGAAQTFSTFSGTVVDPTNRVMPNVTLRLVNSETGAKYEVTSDASGRFQFVGLPPATYRWEAQLVGFATLRGTLNVGGQDLTQNLSLQIGSMEETITVSGAPSRSPESPEKPIDVAAARQRRLARACTAGTTGGQIDAPVKLRDVRPQYPAELNLNKVGGVVILSVVVDQTGDVRDVTVQRSPNPDLAFAAVEAVRQWQYSATRLNCEPIDIRFNVAVNFVAGS